MSRTDVQDTLREMWETRPARPREGRQVAGVAAAIARRYDIDPVLVRVGFVVAALSGIGAALYIAGWIALPEEPATPGAPRARARPGIVMVGLVVAVAISIGTFFDGNGFSKVLPILAVAVLLYLLHRSRGDRGPRPATPDEPTVATPAGPSLLKDTVTEPSPVKEPVQEQAPTDLPAPPTPPSWDPLGAAPFAWDLPEPSSPPPPTTPRRRLPVTPVTLGTALLAGGLTAVVLLTADAFSLANLPVLFGVVLAVIGAGLVVGAFVRSGRGLIPFALLFCALTWATLAAPLDRWQGNGVGDLHAAPTTVAQLQPSYLRTAGDVQLDLRNLDLTVPEGGNSGPVRTTLRIGAGDVTVQVPRDADVTLNATASVGELTFGNRSESGFGVSLLAADDLGADGVRSGRPLVLDIEAGAADVEVRRG